MGRPEAKIIQPVVRNTGDDGIGVVSYAGNNRPVHDIRITSPRFYGQRWDCAFSVVGGEGITYADIYAERSAGASVYIAAEASYDTLGVRGVLVDGGTIVAANQNPAIRHGAILVYNGQVGYANSDITIRRLTVTDTNEAAPRQIGVVGLGCAAVAHSVQPIDVAGGPSPVFFANTDSSAYRLVEVTR